MNINQNFVQVFVLLAKHSSTKGFSFNPNILETNFINILILIGILIYVGKPFLLSTLQTRQEKVFLAIQEAEERLRQANIRLSESEKQLAQTQLVIDQIQQESESTAARISELIIEQGRLDIQRLSISSKISIANAEFQITKQIQQQIATLALKRVMLSIKNDMNTDIQTHIIDNNIHQIGEQF
uniref:ATP synthase subunit b, chloroplastic n=1 Tax=Boldia erythrosiphon TaxID=74908 RepID=A0A1Y9TLX1_9RHOD|nr:ATP synthase CF0 subunit B [Boldia erythrosiphon]ARO90617.1 ATP synthase CF0 subunit B [Boldia erythrosiphon]